MAVKDRYYLKALYKWDDETKYAFFNKYYKNILEECTLMKDADITLQKLKSEGDEINFVTARLMDIDGCETEKITKESLKKFNIPYDSLNLHVIDKVKFFKENNIDICIEDSYETCSRLQSLGIKSILMTTKMNEKIDTKDVVRVNNWNEIYDIIENYKRNLN